MSLRRASLIFAAMLALVGAALAITLIVSTTTLHHAAHEIGAGAEGLRVGEELEFGLVSLRDAREPIARATSETLIRLELADAERYVGNQRERDVLDDLIRKVNAYLEQVENAALATPPGGRIDDKTQEAFEAAFASARTWSLLNLEQSRATKIVRSRWDRIASIVGAAAIIVLLGGIASVALWLQRKTFRPAVQLVRVIERYAGGEVSARAREQGAEELRTIAHQFNDMASSLERQRESQSTFLAGVAHDLRNPLSALKMAIDLIPPDQPLPPEPRLRELIGRIGRQIDRLQRMVYDFLDASRIESGNLELRIEPHDARDLVQATLDLFEPATHTHKLIASIPEAPVELRCDAMRIEQVLSNLVGNAIKYSPPGTTVRLAIAERQHAVELSVIDQGIGISPDDLKHVFEPFRRAHAAKRTAGGIGLGLFVARKIVEAHGGTIAVTSTPGSGSTFTVRLPA